MNRTFIFFLPHDINLDLRAFLHSRDDFVSVINKKLNRCSFDSIVGIRILVSCSAHLINGTVGEHEFYPICN